jgi:type I restriction enzyme S subunit
LNSKWEIKKMPEVIEWGSGGTPKATVKEYYENGDIPWLIIGDLNNGIVTKSETKITKLGLDNSSAKMIPPNTLLVAMYGSIGKLGITGIECCTNQAIAFAKKMHGVTTKYMFYYMAMMKSKLISKGKGGTQKNISQTVLNSLDVIVPPMKEQQRIVTRIEELFSQLDSGVETLKKTKEQLKVYRQAVLKEAFEGRYSSINSFDITSTKSDYDRIRKENVVFKDVSGDENELQIELPDDALLIRFGNIFDVEVGATPKRSVPEYWNGNINWVSSGEVKFQSINNTEEMITENGLQNSSTNVQPIGTVLLAMIGEGKTRGQAAILNIPAAHNQNTAAILVSKTPCNPKYIYHYLNLNYENTRRVGSGNNQKALNKERVRAIRFPFVSFEKQNIIVKEIESRLSVCDSIEKTIDTALQEAEALRQSILKQAFEGGL